MPSKSPDGAAPAALAELIDTLSSIRNARGLSQHAVAETLGVATNTLSRWEAHRRDPSARQLLAWMAALDAHPWLTAQTPTGFVCSIPDRADVVHEHLDALAGPIQWDASQRVFGTKTLADMILARRQRRDTEADPRARTHPRGGAVADDRLYLR